MTQLLHCIEWHVCLTVVSGLWATCNVRWEQQRLPCCWTANNSYNWDCTRTDTLKWKLICPLNTRENKFILQSVIVSSTHSGAKKQNMDFDQCSSQAFCVWVKAPIGGWVVVTLSRKLASPKVTSTDGREATIWNVSGQRSDIVADCVLWQLPGCAERAYQTHAHLS